MAKKRSLPARLREKVMKNGKVYYYYDTCQKPRKWLPLGADFYQSTSQYQSRLPASAVKPRPLGRGYKARTAKQS